METAWTHEQTLHSHVVLTDLKDVEKGMTLSSSRRVHDSGLIINQTNHMAWRPNEYLINVELDNSSPEKVTGWLRFFRRGKRPLRVTFDLAGDFHEDIRGKVIQLINHEPLDKNEQLDWKGTYMQGFSAVQTGAVGDITAGLSLGPWTKELAQKLMAQNELIWNENGVQGAERDRRRQEFAERYRKHIEAKDLYYPYVTYPYIEWYSDSNGRVVLELAPSQVKVIDQKAVPAKKKTAQQLVEDRRRRNEAMATFMGGMLKELSLENRKKGGDGNVSGVVIE